MLFQKIIGLIALVLGTLFSPSANAWFFIFPIPNLAKPAPLNTIIEALEKSNETKAVAYASEDKTFGSKYWVWGHYSGHVTQEEADRIALSRCQAALANAKAQKAGGKELYDFGTKVCELHNFENKTISPHAVAPQREQPTPAIAPLNPASPIDGTPSLLQKETAPINPAPDSLKVSSPPPLPVQKTESEKAIEVESTAVRPILGPAIQTPTKQDRINEIKPQREESQIARRLRELNDLRKEGLITEREYNEKRKAILSAM